MPQYAVLHFIPIILKLKWQYLDNPTAFQAEENELNNTCILDAFTLNIGIMKN